NSQLSTLESFVKLYELLDEIPDFHNEIYGNTENFPYDSLQNKDFLNNIRISPEYSIYPITKMNLDSLESVLSTRKTSDYEGIYHYKNYFKIAIRKRPDSLLEGIVLETKIPSWQRGETILYLLRKQENRFRIFSAKFIDKQLFSGIDRFVNGEFNSSNWQKQPSKIDFYNAAFPKEKYAEKKLNENCTYIKLGSFSSSNQGIAEATDFYNRIKDS
ncbi:hypothetical protein, partial [uncultured Chryseobacterium sp.]|uniref:hypothetical protein n=1 Tax=uncultured Chryseobacterium sp. TaxID=259322 RepID=UPI00260982BC